MTVNGEELAISTLADCNIQSLLEYFKLNRDRIAIELNGRVLKKADYDKTNLSENDKIEIIHFVGGGK